MLIVFAVLKRHGRSAIERLHAFQQQKLAPWLIAYATHPLHTLFMMLVWLAILILSNVTAVALLGGNYFNGLAGIIGCLTLASVGATHRASQQRHDEHSQKLDQIMAHHERHATRLAFLEDEVRLLRGSIALRDGGAAGAAQPTEPSSATATPSTTTRATAQRRKQRRSKS